MCPPYLRESLQNELCLDAEAEALAVIRPSRVQAGELGQARQADHSIPVQ